MIAASAKRNFLSSGCTRATPRYSPPQTPVSANTRATTKYAITMQVSVRPTHRAASETLRGGRTLISDRSRMVSPIPTCHSAPCPDLPRPAVGSKSSAALGTQDEGIRYGPGVVPTPLRPSAPRGGARRAPRGGSRSADGEAGRRPRRRSRRPSSTRRPVGRGRRSS